MPHRQCRLGGHDKQSSRQRPSPPRPLKDTCCIDCQMRESPVQPSSSSRESCPQKREFAPTGKPPQPARMSTGTDNNTANRFSILANLDQQAKHTKWAFDFVQTSSNVARRRGKRAGKNSRPKYAKQPSQDDRKNESDGVEELYKKMAANILEREEPIAAATQFTSRAQRPLPRTNFSSSSDTVQHNWMPQFRPNSLSTQSSLPRSTPTTSVKAQKVEFPQPPDRCLTQSKPLAPRVGMPDSKRRESRFFPLSAFLVTSETAARYPSPSVLPALSFVPSAAKKQPSIVIPSLAQRSAASAVCRALATQRTAVPAVTVPLRMHDSRPTSSFPLAHPISPPVTPNLPTTGLSFAPMLITPPLAVSPMLTTSPALSSPSLISAPPSLPPHTLLSPFNPSLSSPWDSAFGHATPVSTSPRSLIESPIDTPFTSSLLPGLYATPKPSPSVNPPIASTPILKKKSVSMSILTTSLPTATPTTSTTVGPQAQKQLADFLKLGHGDPCWCRSHGDWAFPPQSKRPIVKLPPAATVREQVQEKLIDVEENVTSAEMTMHDELVGVRQRTLEGLSDDELDLHDVVLTPSSTCSSRMSFEDLGDWALQSPRSDLSDNEGSDAGWEIVSSGSQYRKRASFSSTSTPTSHEHESETEGGVSLTQNPTPTSSALVVLNCPPPPSQQHELPDQKSTNATSARPNSPAGPPIKDPSKLCTQCLTCNCACVASSPNPTTRLCTTPDASDSITIFHGPRTSAVAVADPTDLVYLAPSTQTSLPALEHPDPMSSTEWPTLQEAIGLLPTRVRARRYQRRSSVGSAMSCARRRESGKESWAEVKGRVCEGGMDLW